VDLVDVGKDEEVKMRPGQVLHIVNKLYPFVVQFGEESEESVTEAEEKIQTEKRPCEDSCENDDIENVPKKAKKMEVVDTQSSSADLRPSKSSVSPHEGTTSRKASVLVPVLLLFLLELSPPSEDFHLYFCRCYLRGTSQVNLGPRSVQSMSCHIQRQRSAPDVILLLRAQLGSHVNLSWGVLK